MVNKAYDFLLNDPTLNNLVKRYPLQLIVPTQTPLYESLIKAIISQQLSVKAADTIYGRFISLFGNQSLSLETLLSMDHEILRSVGLSNQKAHYTKYVADFFLREENSMIEWEQQLDTEIIEKLTSIKGVGEWTVHMILIFNLGRSDVLPLGDLIVKRGLMKLLKIKSDDKNGLSKIIKKSQKWSPHRSYVSRLMWAAKDDVISF